MMHKTISYPNTRVQELKEKKMLSIAEFSLAGHPVLGLLSVCRFACCYRAHLGFLRVFLLFSRLPKS